MESIKLNSSINFVYDNNFGFVTKKQNNVLEGLNISHNSKDHFGYINGNYVGVLKYNLCGKYVTEIKVNDRSYISFDDFSDTLKQLRRISLILNGSNFEYGNGIFGYENGYEHFMWFEFSKDSRIELPKKHFWPFDPFSCNWLTFEEIFNEISLRIDIVQKSLKENLKIYQV